MLYWTSGFPPLVGGLELFSARLAESLVARGHRLSVLTLSTDARDEHGRMADGTELLRLPFAQAFARRDPEALGRLRRRVAKLKRDFAPDLIHLHAINPGLVFHLETREACRAPSLLTFHGVPGLSFRPGSPARRLLEQAEAVTACSQAVLESIQVHAPEIATRSRVIHNGARPPEFEPSPLGFAPPRLLALGRLAPEKGFDLALEALALLAPRFPELRLDLVGDGPERAALEAQAGSLGLGDRVRFLGEQSPAEVARHIDAATLLVLPSRREGFGLAALEAMLGGRPVVASAVGGLPELLGHGKAGVLVAPENAKELAAGIARLLDDPERTRARARAAQSFALEHFGWETCVDRYEELYRELAERNAT